LAALANPQFNQAIQGSVRACEEFAQQVRVLRSTGAAGMIQPNPMSARKAAMEAV